MSTETTAAWPRVEAVIKDDGTGEVSIGGTPHPIRAESLAEARTAAVSLVAQTADKLGRKVRATMSDPDGDWPLIIHADGTVEEDKAAEARPRPRPEAAAVPLEQAGPVPVSTEPAKQSGVNSAQGWVRPAGEQAENSATPAAYPPRRERRQSFLIQEQVEEPATQGWRGILARAGIRMSPSEAERAERADVQAVSQHWPGPRTIAIVNGKGGAGKTPSTVLLAAVFARYGGAGVLTWDNNQTRGTLGWRTEQGPHEATLLELLPQVERLLSTGAQSADLAHYVHHQTRDRFDVLRSKPMELASAQRVDAADVDSIHEVASKYYRLIFIDSGNDESDPMWRRMIDHTDQLVVATTTRDDHAEAGALLLEALEERDERSARLARQAVVIVNQADPKAHTADLARVATGYQDLAREAITIPFDPAMVDGVLRYGSLRPATQRAWLAAGAEVARGL
ncbi:AAA family ATPase [Paenarthrobacter ureafaciens]|uniref:AAA family ATPase n=1 Tax=Paenarthrobacter ureafaciens TaxID=37931 RepID=UPI0034639CBE